ncbi:hypothetical protein Lesp02_64960 [Lentzea sp. NBRC 105346]|nr:hypothetical protein Lesp02_64960 [Lentzea sp. NBRC 105346]
MVDVAEDALDLLQFKAWVRQAKDAKDAHIASALLTRALELWRGEPLSDVPSETLRRGTVVALIEQRLAAEKLRSELTVVPRQLPSSISQFVGRSEQLRELDAMLTSSDGTMVISALGGTPGIGKTALAVHWAHRVADRFPDGQLYVNLRGFDPSGAPKTPEEAIRGFLDAFKVPRERIPHSADQQAALYRELMAGKRVLLILDNARDADQVLPLLPAGSGCSVVVTSRDTLTELTEKHSARRLVLDVLGEEDAAALLARHLGRERVDVEPDALAELIDRCARLPLALTIAAATAAHSSFALSGLSEELRDEQARLDALDTGDPLTDVRTVFSWSYQQLSPPAARVFRLLGEHRGPDISLNAAASLCGSSRMETAALIDELVRSALLSQTAPGRYAFHDLLRVYALGLPDEGRHAATHRVLDHYLHSAYAAESLFNPNRFFIELKPAEEGVRPEEFTDADHARAWFAIERPVLTAAVTHAADVRADTQAWQLSWAVASFLDRSGYWQDWARIQPDVTAAAERLGDLDAQARSALIACHAYARLGSFPKARIHAASALDAYQRLNDLELEAGAHSTLGWLYEQEDRFDAALVHSNKAAQLYRATGNKQGEAKALNAMGWDHAQLGCYEESIICCEQAVELFKETNDHFYHASTLDSIGFARHKLGEHELAIAMFREALELRGTMNDLLNSSTILTHLGDALRATGDIAAARDAWQHALDNLVSLGHPDAAGVKARLEDS